MSPGATAKLRRALATPPVLLAALLLLAAAIFALTGIGTRAKKPTPVATDTTTTQVLTPTEVRLLLVDADGLQRPRFETLDLPEGASARLTAIVATLRDILVAEGTWPQALATPEVFAQDVGGRSVAVLDVRASADVAVSVTQELQMLRSIQGTLRGRGVDEVRFLRDGLPATTLLGHVAVASGL